jgi:2-amino-4-hydroxy-6-hydroxymethyldihydropteridine diphosphokinase
VKIELLNMVASRHSVRKRGILLIGVSNMIVAMGSNQNSSVGMPALTLKKAAQAMESRGAVIRKMSTFYQTPCFPAGAGPDYVNAALSLQAPWTARETLAHLHEVEQEFGRNRVKRWGQRTLDLDLIAMEDVVAPDLETYNKWRNLPLDLQKERAPSELILPHPRLQDRAFVLVPMLEVVDDWVHPVSGLSVQQMLDAIPSSEKDEVIPFEN